MHRNITIGQEAYKLLSSLKAGDDDSFTKVILRHVRKPADTAGELLESFAGYVPPPVDDEVERAFIKGRKRRSRRK